jgi:hypothetical protein
MGRDPKLLALLLVGACTSTGGFDVESTPSGAEVLSSAGEVLGRTPLRIESGTLDKAQHDGLIALRLRSPGHTPKDVFAPITTTRELLVKLVPASEESFRNELMPDFSKQQNLMLREAFQIQNLVQLGKATEATPLLNDFTAKYPSIAFPHIMRANLEIMAGRQGAALDHLVRASALDPGDPVVVQMRKMIEGAKP